MDSSMTAIPGIDPSLISHGAALAVLGTICVCGLSGLGLVGFLIGGRRRPALISGGIGLATALLYAVGCLGFTLLGRERTLSRGEEKYFCNLDCHLAYSVRDVRVVPSIGEGASAVRAAGQFYLVTIRARFDETTIASFRPRDAPLMPDPHEFIVVNGSGSRYPISEVGQRALDAIGGSGESLMRPLNPGQSFLHTLVYDLPADARGLRLLIRDVSWDYGFTIGHENSPLAHHTFLSL